MSALSESASPNGPNAPTLLVLVQSGRVIWGLTALSAVEAAAGQPLIDAARPHLEALAAAVAGVSPVPALVPPPAPVRMRPEVHHGA